MKKFELIIFLILLGNFTTFSQEEVNFNQYANNSFLLSKGEYKYSLFAKGEYGLSDKVSLRLHPLWLFLAPSIDIKWQWLKTEKYSLTFIHGISTPTPIMNLLAAEGTGGLISPEFKIPFMLSIRNGLISTWNLGTNHKATGELAFAFALLNDKLLPGSSIDLPIVSPRNSIYYKNFELDLGMGVEGKLLGRFAYYTKGQVFLFPIPDDDYTEEYGKTGRYFGELTSMIFWNTSKKCKFGLGTRLSYGDYPFGHQWHLLPMIDFVKYNLK